MESEFCAMLHFLFPDELLFLYADADARSYNIAV